MRYFTIPDVWKNNLLFEPPVWKNNMFFDVKFWKSLENWMLKSRINPDIFKKGLRMLATSLKNGNFRPLAFESSFIVNHAHFA